MAARVSTPVIGELCSRAERNEQSPGFQRWTLTTGYRYLPSHRHFIGTVEQVQRARLGTEINNRYHIFDIGLQYRLDRRWSLTASVPLVRAWRNQLYNPRGEFSVFSQGDATVGARAWLWKPPTENQANISLGASLKMPTGRYRVNGSALNNRGERIIATADQSIQPGDGGTGMAVDLTAFTPVGFRTLAYFSGLYLFNPRDTNGVSTFRARRGEEVMSVSDQYMFRGGLSRSVPWVRWLFASFGGRIEGVPVRDAFGRSNGFRRPGYAISIDPGVLYQRGSYVFSLNVPVAVERNRRRSVTDIANRFHGDAAFADYSIIFAVSKMF